MDQSLSRCAAPHRTLRSGGEDPLQRSSRWLRSHSIRVRLYSVFAILFLLVIGLGVVGFVRLSDVNHASEVIRNHWLRDTRILGDLNNYMSDYRAAEAARLLATTPAELARSEAEMASLGATVARSQGAYEEISQAPAEARLYRDFSSQWSAYRRVAVRVIALARGASKDEAVALYNTDSRRAFDLSSDTLGRLTEQTVVEARADSNRATATYKNARAMIVTAVLLAAVLFFSVIIFITRFIMAPLVKLAGSMRELAEHHTDIAIPSVQREDEIGEIARAVAFFRDNALALAASQRRLIEQAAALESGLEHERRLTAQQRDFIAMTSHEFLTPLTIIDGHAQRLIKMSDRLDAADIAERGTSIRAGVQRITDIMDSLLGASRHLDDHAVYRPTDFEPSTLLHEVCQAHRDANGSVVIAEQLGTLPRSMRGDPKLLFHAFSNLISNAIKYSPAASPVEVLARQESDWLVLKVRDYGIGIPAPDREHLFKRYFRGSNATGIAGTGVGLHLVSIVVGLHHGEVFAESLETGSQFTLRLPIGPLP